MIIAFDHVAYGCMQEDLIRERARLEALGYCCRLEEDIPNLAIKRPLLREFTHTHTLVLMAPANEEGLPIELTAYKRTFPLPPVLRMRSGDVLELLSPAPMKTATFLSRFGFRSAGDALIFASPLPPKQVQVQVTQGEAGPWLLDQEGFCCLAFVSTNAAREREALAREYACTPLTALEVGQRTLELFFATGPHGELVEVFSVKKPEKDGLP